MRRHIPFVIGLLSLGLAPTLSTAASPGNGLGIRAGMGLDPDQFVVGAQAEFGPLIGPAYLVPSVDAGFGDGSTLISVNGDLRWYLLPLPESSVTFYGSAGPTLLFGGGDTAVGLSLAAGANIPMRGGRRYNAEVRFGFGDIPDIRILLAVVFGS